MQEYSECSAVNEYSLLSHNSINSFPTHAALFETRPADGPASR